MGVPPPKILSVRIISPVAVRFSVLLFVASSIAVIAVLPSRGVVIGLGVPVLVEQLFWPFVLPN